MRYRLPGLVTLILVSCSSFESPLAPSGAGKRRPDAGIPGSDGGVAVPDGGAAPTRPPPRQLSISGRVLGMGDALAGRIMPVQSVSVLTYGVTPAASVVTDAQGGYRLTVPANGQVILFANRTVGQPGFFPSYVEITAGSVDIQGQDILLTEQLWMNAVGLQYGVGLSSAFPCSAPGNPAVQCIYGILVGRLLDDGAQLGTPRPVGGVPRAAFQIARGPNDAPAVVRGPYFLEADGKPGDSPTTRVSPDGTAGGLFVAFVEMPQVAGPAGVPVSVSARAGPRTFGPVRAQVFRPYGVTWVEVPETGAPPPLDPRGIDFDSQIYPLFLTVAQGGLGCQGCHTNQAGVAPAGGLNLYGGPSAAYASLDPMAYPSRVDVAAPDRSLLLKRPLYEADGPQDHPIFAFASTEDPGYRLVRQWIMEGAARDRRRLPVSFYREVRPLLAASSNNGGAGCDTCHIAQVDQATAPANLYMGGTAGELLFMLTRALPTDRGQTVEAYRVNTSYPERSLLLLHPLMGSALSHPVKTFSSSTDPRYQRLNRWIREGARDVREAPQEFAAGEVTTTAAGVNLGYSLEGSAFLIRDPVLGETNVGLFVLGLNASSTYMAHVHEQSCLTGGGAHYRIDPAVQGVRADNEIWPTVTTAADGKGWGTVRVPHVARSDARSIVIHENDPNGTRIACVDLTPDARLTAEAQLAPLGTGAGRDLSGTAVLTRMTGGTEVHIRLQGVLLPGRTYPAHVHDAPCATNRGGAHYKFDVTEGQALRDNEIWPELRVGATSGMTTPYGTGEAYVPHVARFDAWSVVVHDADDPTVRLACASLELGRVDTDPLRFSYDTITTGSFRLTADGVARQVAFSGSAALVRNARGDTSAMVWVRNAMPGTTYPAHVHDGPCAAGGGAHYKVRRDIAGEVEANEIWPTITVAPDGHGFGGAARLGHIARVDARSVVIHDPTDGKRLACADLGPSGEVVSRGTFVVLPDGRGFTPVGTAEVRRVSGRGTWASVQVSGRFQAGVEYPSHVHNAACSDRAGGGHYQVQVGGAVDRYNEIWPTVQMSADGSRGEGRAYTPHIGRHDARSVVIHDPANNNARIACADLR